MNLLIVVILLHTLFRLQRCCKYRRIDVQQTQVPILQQFATPNAYAPLNAGTIGITVAERMSALHSSHRAASNLHCPAAQAMLAKHRP